MRGEVKKKDEELALLAQSGNAAAMEELLLRYKNVVRSRARQFFLQGGETEDLVQEGMIGLYGAVLRYNPASGKSFKNFAYVCTSQRIFDALKIADRHSTQTDGSDPDTLYEEALSPEDMLIDGEEEIEFRAKLLKTLSDFEYRVIRLYLDGMSYAAISEATGKSEKSIDNALSRAKRKLQNAYQKK